MTDLVFLTLFFPKRARPQSYKFQVPAFLDFRCFYFRNFRFHPVYNSTLFSSPLVLLSNLDFRSFFDHCATYLPSENTEWNIAKLDQIEKFGLSENAALISIFCSIGKIQQNFLVPRMVESGRQTFMLIRNLDLHRVKVWKLFWL